MHPSTNDQVISLLIIAAFIAICAYRYRWKGSGTAFGTSSWMSDQALRAWGFLSRSGLVVGRTFKGALIRLPRYCHVLLCGCTGSGKGVSILLPNLFSYRRGSIVCFDTKGDLFATSAERRAAWGERNLRLAPFNGGKETFNPLASISRDSPMLVDSARAMAEALVVRQGTEPDPHWNEMSVKVICAVMVLVLIRFPDEERNLNSVQEIVSDPDMLRAAAERLRELGGIPARLGNQLNTLFDKQTTAFTKEGASVLRNTFNPSRESVADHELGLYGTETQGEIAKARRGPGDGLEQESSAARQESTFATVSLDDLRAYAKELSEAQDRSRQQGKEQGKEQTQERDRDDRERE